MDANDTHNQFPNASDPNLDHSDSLVYTVIFMSVNAAVGVVCNIAVSVLIITREQFKSRPSNIYTLNRALGDLMQQSIIPLVVASWLTQEDFFNKDPSCLVSSAIVQVGFLSSAAFLVFLVSDCLLSTKFEISHRQKVRWWATPAIWIAAIILTIPNFWIQMDNGSKCHKYPLYYPSASYLILPFMILQIIIFLSASITLCCSQRFRKIRLEEEEGQVKWSAEVSPADRQMNEDKIKGVGEQDDETRVVDKDNKPEENDTEYLGTEDSTELVAQEICEVEIERQAVSTMGMNEVPISLIAILIVIFGACQIPYWVYNFFLYDEFIEFYTGSVNFELFLANPTLNPILWLVWNRSKLC